MEAAFWHNLLYNLTHLGVPDDTHPVTIAEKIVRPVVAYLLLVVSLKLVGKRMLAQLNPFDFVVLLTLSNTVQNAIIGNDTSLWGGVVGAAALLGANALLVRAYYRGPSEAAMTKGDEDICLISHGRLEEPVLRRLHINAAELTAKAHERGFDSLDEVDAAMLYPNGTIYFHGKLADTEQGRHAELLSRLDALRREVAALGTRGA
ncbi:MAG: DUF421 domain-containing protein [Gemmatimonadales bacterium]|nr:DUF421 domain-containing protein [Gemmatimonadales bacterium]